jgi:hypothetical protein
MPIVQTTYFVPAKGGKTEKRKQVLAVPGADGRPVILKDGAAVSPRDWEKVRQSPVVRRMLDDGRLRVDFPIEELVASLDVPTKPDQADTADTAKLATEVPDETK